MGGRRISYGRRASRPRIKRIPISLTSEEHWRVRTLAQAAGVSASCWIREAMWQRFDRDAIRGAGPAAAAGARRDSGR